MLDPPSSGTPFIILTVNPKILVSFDSFRYVVQLEETGVTLMRKATRMLKFNQKR